MRKSNIIICLVCLAALACLPLYVHSEYFVNIIITLFIYIILSQSWNLLGGYTGQISLGHAAFFGAGALVTRLTWLSGVPIIPALCVGAAASVTVALIVGIPSLRIQAAYFPVGTLALSMIALIAVGNNFPIPGTLPRDLIKAYDVNSRYYLTLAVMVIAMLVIWKITTSRTGMAIKAIRDDETAAEALGIRALYYKSYSLLFSSFFAGLAGGLYAYHNVSYYYDTTFVLSWSFIPPLTTYIGGVGTILGPILGSAFFVVLSEAFSALLGDVHVIIFGICFILIILFFPGGLVSLLAKFKSFLSTKLRGSK